jgi:PAS domain S-box-containing protein
MSEDIDILNRKLVREKKARHQAERVLEKKSLQLHQANENLRKINSELEQRVTERTLRLNKTESRFQLLVETASDFIYRTNAQGYFTYANPTALNKTGYSLEELKKMCFTDLIDAKYVTDIQLFYDKQIISQQVKSYKEFPIKSKTKEAIWLGQNVNFIYNTDGSLNQVMAVARDITEIKLSRTRLQNLISSLQSGVLLEDENKKIVLSNQTFCDMFTIPALPDALVGADCSDSAEESKVAFADEQMFVDRIGEILTNKREVLNDELELKDGRIFERDYIPIYIENLYSGHLWNYRDVTKQRNILSAIKRSEEKYRSIIENMNLGLLEVDEEDKILYANQSFCNMSGFRENEILEKVATKLFVSGESEDVLEEKKTLRIVGVSDAYEIAVKNKRGETKWWLVSGAPLFDEMGMKKGSVGIHLDITTQKEIEKELVNAKYQAEASSKVMELFLANMSHEIRTPMNGILGMAVQLDKGDLTESQQFKLDIIRSAADNLMVILNDILDLSKIEAGKLNIENVTFNLASCLNKASELLLPKAKEKGLTLDIEVDPKISPFHTGDPFRIKQVLFNLVGNAIKFTHKGGVKITAELSADKGQAQLIQITVEDSGIGIDKEYLEKIFEKFSQEDRSTARKFGGTGLGMNISKQLIELMGGEIELASEKGKGTKVILRMPFFISVQQIESDLEVNEPIADYSALEGKNILVAEDNEMNRLVIETTLAEYKLKLHFATNGKEAINMLNEKPMDLILMDIQMPIMDGIEATLYIRKELKNQLPIVALTANVLKGDTKRYLKAGMNDTVPKPFEEEQIVNVLLKWLCQKKVRKSRKGERGSVNTESYSLQKLRKIGQGDEAFVAKMVSIFIQQAIISIEGLRNAQKEKDYKKIGELAHKIKPSFDNLEIFVLKENVRKLEKIENETPLEELPALVEEFCGVLEVVIAKLEGYSIEVEKS